MKIGNRIKKLREEANLTQRQLATALGCSPGLVGQWESHEKMPGRDLLGKLSVILVTDMEYLLHGAPPKGALISDHRELTLLRKFRNLDIRQRENWLELLGVSGDIRREIEQKSEPTEP